MPASQGPELVLLVFSGSDWQELFVVHQLVIEAELGAELVDRNLCDLKVVLVQRRNEVCLNVYDES